MPSKKETVLVKISIPKFENQYIICAQTVIFYKNVSIFQKDSWSSISFLELGSQDPPKFACLIIESPSPYLSSLADLTTWWLKPCTSSPYSPAHPTPKITKNLYTLKLLTPWLPQPNYQSRVRDGGHWMEHFSIKKTLDMTKTTKKLRRS